jgi:hypothetical protein
MTQFEWVAASVIAVLAAARLTRLFVWDAYPPTAWLRSKWDARTEDSDWNLLLHCGYCFGMYVALFVMGWGAVDLYLGDGLHLAWWVFHGWLAMSYLAAIVMAYDGEEV